MPTSRSWAALASAATLLCATACSSRAEPRMSAPINEASGLVASRKHPGIFWTHNDSGDEARLFAIRLDGTLVATVPLVGARNVDWEDVTADDQGNLYVGDIGNNQSRRTDLTIYKVPEPDPAAPGRVAATQTMAFHYPDQGRFPDPDKGFDAEALFWAQGQLYLLTKPHRASNTVLYRFENLSGKGDQALKRLGSFDTRVGKEQRDGRVTGADATPDGRYLAVLTYGAVLLFERPAQGDNYLDRPLKRIELAQDALEQCESIAWDGLDVVITNEQGRIFRLPQPLSWSGGRWNGG